MERMELRVLGPLEVIGPEGSITIAAPRQRQVLAALILNANQAVSRDRLLDIVWGEELPSNPDSALRFQISKLRSALGPLRDIVATVQSSYVLRVDEGDIDAVRFVELVRAAEHTVDSDPRAALRAVDEARGLWRGGAYAELSYENAAQLEIMRLDGLRERAAELGLRARLNSGEAEELIPELEAGVAAGPMREQLWEMLMVALYRAGRQADALRAFRRAQETLGEELGIEPSPELRALEEQILLQDPQLRPARMRVARGNLPAATSDLVGRERDLEDLMALVAGQRLTSLVGVGGVGKTRLVLEAGRRSEDRFPDGVWFTDLSALGPGDDVAARIASDLGIHEGGDLSPVDAVTRWFSDRDCLLIVDNCEQVIDEAAATVSRLLQSSARGKVVTTSRERLAVAGEHVFALSGLTPDPVAGDDPAVELFIRRARAARRDFTLSAEERPLLTRLCTLLDGLPLAIELAAAHARALSTADLVATMEHQFGLLSDARRGGPERHRTLWTTLDWSFDLLEEWERAAFAALGLFRGDFDLAAVEAVTGLSSEAAMPTMVRMVDTSLVHRAEGPTPGTRFRLLEMVRQYAVHRLDPGAAVPTRARFVAYYAALAEEARVMLDGSNRRSSIERLEEDHDNLRAAIEMARDEGDGAAEIRLVSSLAAYWFETGHHSEGRTILARTVDGAREPTEQLARAIEELVQLYAWAGAPERAEALIADQERVATAVGNPRLIARVAASRALLAFTCGDYDTALAEYGALAEHLAPDPTASLAYLEASRAVLELWRGEFAAADGHIAEAKRWAGVFVPEETGAILGDYVGWRAFYRGDHAAARTAWRDTAAEYARLGQAPMAADMAQLDGWLMLIDGDDEAAGRIEQSIEDMERLGLEPFVARGEILAAAAAAERGEAAAGMLAEATRRSWRAGNRVWTFYGLWYGARLAADRGDLETARSLRSAAETLRAAIPLALPDRIGEMDRSLAAALAVGAWEQGTIAAFDLDAALEPLDVIDAENGSHGGVDG
jgi:predicted ATPase/DNA-binding SARP family transcriptional activator